ncbi:MAG: lipoyl(octanoyl) transferase LipB, partial [Betaproteobacteria bacterium]
MLLRHLGRAEYLPTSRAMREFTGQRTRDTADELWLVEHPPVFTLGQAGRRDHLLAPGDIEVVQSDRGGQVTYHGPGQVVAYPLVDLRRLGIYVKELVYRIEQSVIQVLDHYGLDGR